MKSLKLYVFLFVLITLYVSCSFAKNCGYNKYGNYYCHNDDGTYEYWNKQEKGNPYYGLPYYKGTEKKTYTQSYSYSYSDIIDAADKYCKKYVGNNSYYDSSLDACVCNDGYFILNGKCISANSYCTNNYGKHSYYDKLKDSCKCSNGYIVNDDGICITYDSWCKGIMGNYGYYDLSMSGCNCKQGYLLDEYYKCTIGKIYCSNTYGSNSYFDSKKNSCMCNEGYFLLNGKCVSGDEYCTLKMGPSAYMSGGCYCDDGYIMSYGKCISGNNYCKNQFGQHSFYNISDSACYCEKGYYKNKAGTKCKKKIF